MDWDKTVEHARRMMKLYSELPDRQGRFGEVMIKVLLNHYEAGNRSKKLYKEMEAIE